MTSAKTGLWIGAVIVIVWVVLGFWVAVFVAVAMAIGALIGRIADGKLDVRGVLDSFRGRRSSS